MKITAQMKGVDYATPLEPAKVAELGYAFVARYINGKPTWWKVLTPGERDALHAAGLGIVLVWETGATRPLAGTIAGTRDGQLATLDADRLGYPKSMPIVVAVDIDTTTTNAAAVLAYWRAFRDACSHPVGVYGDWDVIDAIGGESALNWQANARWWSRDAVNDPMAKKPLRVHPLTHMRQEDQQTIPGVGTLDPNTCRREFVAWHPTINQEDNDVSSYVLIELEDAEAKFIGFEDSKGRIYKVEWTGPGSDPAVQARIAFLGDDRRRRRVADLKVTTLDGQLPYGDAARDWDGSEFFRVVD